MLLRNHTTISFPSKCLFLITAMGTAEQMFNHVFRYFGIPEDIVSNRGPQFISRVWKNFLKLLGVTVSLSSGYHPQTNGQTERKIQEIGRFLQTFCHGHQHSWKQFISWAEYAQNSLRQQSTGLTPFQCMLGFQPPLFPWDGVPSDVPAVDYWFRESERVWDEAHHHLRRAMRRRKLTADLRRSDPPPYQPGQKVWLSTRDIRFRPATLAPSSSRSRLTWSRFNSSYPLNTGFIPLSTSHFSNLINLLSLHPQSLARLQNPSPADSGGWSGLRGQNHLGLSTPWWSAGITRRFGGVWTRGEVMDSQRRHPG